MFPVSVPSPFRFSASVSASFLHLLSPSPFSASFLRLLSPSPSRTPPGDEERRVEVHRQGPQGVHPPRLHAAQRGHRRPRPHRQLPGARDRARGAGHALPGGPLQMPLPLPLLLVMALALVLALALALALARLRGLSQLSLSPLSLTQPSLSQLSHTQLAFTALSHSSLSLSQLLVCPRTLRNCPHPCLAWIFNPPPYSLRQGHRAVYQQRRQPHHRRTRQVRPYSDPYLAPI